MFGKNIKVANKNNRKNQTILNKCLFSANVFVSFFCICSFIALWQFLPQTIPAHWTSDWTIDRFASRNEIFIHFILVVVLLVSEIIAYLVLEQTPYEKISISITHGLLGTFQLAYLIFIVTMYDKYLSNAQSFYIWFSAVLITCCVLYVVTLVSIIIRSKKSIISSTENNKKINNSFS